MAASNSWKRNTRVTRSNWNTIKTLRTTPRATGPRPPSTPHPPSTRSSCPSWITSSPPSFATSAFAESRDTPSNWGHCAPLSVSWRIRMMMELRWIIFVLLMEMECLSLRSSLIKLIWLRCRSRCRRRWWPSRMVLVMKQWNRFRAKLKGYQC